MPKKFKRSKRKHKVSRKKIPNRLLLQIILAAIAAVFLIYIVPSDVTVATVDGEAITKKRVDALFNSLPEGSDLTRNDIIDRLIDTKILVLYIESQGLEMSDEEFQLILDARLTETGTNLEDLQRDLALRGATLEDVRESFMIEKFVEEVVKPQIVLTYDDINEYINANDVAGLTGEDVEIILVINKQKEILEDIITTHAETLEIKIR